MKELSIDVINNQFTEFWGNMIEAGLDKYYDSEALKKLLSISPAGTNEESGLAYPGALLIHINLVVGLAKRYAPITSRTFKDVTIPSLIKVCILQNLSKITMFKINDNEWEAKNRGINYKFNDLDGRMKTGSRSLFYAVKNGVEFDAFEWEAMESIDRDDEKKGAKSFDCPLSLLVRHANETATLIARERYNEENNK